MAQYKQCPKCGAQHQLADSSCTCGHQFSTKFGSSNLGQTKSFTPPGSKVTMKSCPKCGLTASLMAKECVQCLHAFRTVFGPTPPPVQPQPPPPPPPPPDPGILARQRQHALVLQDPKYLLNSGIGVLCPQCGSSNLVLVNKQGTGFSFFGSVEWVLAAVVVDSWVQKAQKQPAQCNYCQAHFELAYH